MPDNSLFGAVPSAPKFPDVKHQRAEALKPAIAEARSLPSDSSLGQASHAPTLASNRNVTKNIPDFSDFWSGVENRENPFLPSQSQGTYGYPPNYSGTFTTTQTG